MGAYSLFRKPVINHANKLCWECQRKSIEYPEDQEDGQEMVGRVTLKLLQEPFVKTGSNGRRSGIWGGVGEKGQISPSQTC